MPVVAATGAPATPPNRKNIVQRWESPRERPKATPEQFWRASGAGATNPDEVRELAMHEIQQACIRFAARVGDEEQTEMFAAALCDWLANWFEVLSASAAGRGCGGRPGVG